MAKPTPKKAAPVLLTAADKRLLEEMRARAEHPYATVRRWQAAGLLHIIDKLRAAVPQNMGVAS
ncbi:hypothetical protein [Desulfovibrio desulfuricans]|uniref:hypothetical protein n=1 Tax=Desulfovibrio desulfuricans TaxID=876 RepID=UPI0039846079